jgi:class 3 adenylate cyclase
MGFTDQPLLEQICARIAKSLKDGIQLNMSTEESKKLLRRHVNAKTNLVIMFVDINNSTQMSQTQRKNTGHRRVIVDKEDRRRN